jgi:hypothetical protein
MCYYGSSEIFLILNIYLLYRSPFYFRRHQRENKYKGTSSQLLDIADWQNSDPCPLFLCCEGIW